jgi:hypothetical protein
MAEQAASHPRIEKAILGALRAELPNLIEQMLSQMCGGETLRMYVRKRPAHAKMERNMRIQADAASQIPLAMIAKREDLTLRQVQRIVRTTKAGLEMSLTDGYGHNHE